jgi:hypothetical protein
MQEYFTINKPIRMADLFDGRLEKHGVQEHHSKNTTPQTRCLTDGENFVWAGSDRDDLPVSFTRYRGNNANTILDAVAAEFDVDFSGDADNIHYELNEPATG